MMSDGAQNRSDDVLDIVEDEPPPPPAGGPRWRVLIVDDDEDVHASTAFALRHTSILGRRLDLVHARSAGEAWERVNAMSDIAVALVDVVMETPDAGLRLVHDLRAAGFRAMRLILRTGQPGYAPEPTVIASYEIDDYRTKAELTQSRLLTVLTTAIRAYDQIRTIERSRAGLEMIVDSASRLFHRTNFDLFTRGVLTQIASLLQVPPSGLVGLGRGGGQAAVVQAEGRFDGYKGKALGDLSDADVRRLLQAARGSIEPVVAEGFTALHFRSDTGCELSAVVEAGPTVAPADLALLKLFATNVGIGFENLALVERLDQLAHFDPILNIPNANALEAALRKRLDGGWDRGGLAVVRVDAYRSVVAAHGIDVANGLLLGVYRALCGDARLVARIGDRAFVVLGDRDAIDADLIRAAVADPVVVHGIDVATTATAVLFDLADLPRSPRDAVSAAIAALLHAVRRHPGLCMRYDGAMRTEVERRNGLQLALKQAVRICDGFAVHLQPKWDLATGALSGAEALLRWSHAGEPVSPAEFIPIAEWAGLTAALTEHVIRTVGAWRATRQRNETLPVAINLSMVDLNVPGFATRLILASERAGLAPAGIEFEVTEGVAMQDTPWAIFNLHALKAAGFGIALDDFGTGFSSLSQFDAMPVDTLKIDRSFVAPLTPETARGSLADIVIAMARSLKVTCVAEGIETEAQRQALATLGCPVGQGYLLGRPVPIELFDDRFPAS